MYQEESFKTQKVVYAHTRSDEADMEYRDSQRAPMVVAVPRTGQIPGPG